MRLFIAFASLRALFRISVALGAAGYRKTQAVFTLVLANARRIESEWNFNDAELARLIRIAEEA